ncbi:MAG: magnesium-translocating P-type ATPase [Christensenella sp.]|uniref:magnesium-translocating P-type ATPase n=1 Tax=Christensenella sp. TaxID=1935934 RepID=UPI002B1EB0A6|nr:magnesium-translocating P-type ATPase [Christensenella sp.]MEA5004127.1 magnesium-translocating P-type ATPase [Christensenella sp.]
MKKNIALPLSASMQANKRLVEASQKSQDSVLDIYTNTYEGYAPDDVREMRDRFGENRITYQKGDSLLKRLVRAFINPFTLVLIALAIISFFTDFLFAESGDQDILSVVIVLSMVIVSGTLQFVQETRSEKSAEKLSEMVETTTAVIREGKESEIPLDEIVTGDIIRLAAGDMIPADVRILQAKDLFVSQSSLTGESEPVEKFGRAIKSGEPGVLDKNNLAFMGSNVVSGSATAIVITVGDDTMFGSLAHQITEKKPKTSFEKGLNSVSWILIRFMLVMVPIVLFLNGFTKGDWMQAFLFAISVAVGLTPEMLPMIVSANLAKGAVAMSKKKVIVKDLHAIQNFGAMDVLCTDKTGTLTQDKVVLEYSLDIHGNEDERVLRHAFLNSYHQTGLKNLMDIAVVDHAEEQGMAELIQNYQKVDEIPFDFNRRRMSVVVEDKNGKTQLITKGAIEEMLAVSTYAEYQGKVEPITDEVKDEILKTVATYNANGMRVLGIAHKTNPSPAGAFSVADESDMVLIGYLAFLDPPKESTKKALKALLEYGVDVKVLTGDNDAVTKYICRKVGISADHILLGADVEAMDDDMLLDVVEGTHVFAKLSPSQKSRIVSALRAKGHTVGFLGDGINDAAAMKEADVGISVDTAVDIAKESANIILMEKDLMVLEEGVIEGRKTYANSIKYIKMTASSNFGNMFSVLAASAFLPFLPMTPVQILLLNLIYDVSCLAMPWDNVDADYLKKPRKWDASSISKFMVWIGPTSSVFDITTYLLLYFVICPLVIGGAYHTLGEGAQESFVALFHAGWFVESLWTQTLVIHLIRTPHTPFIKSRASWQVTLLTTIGIIGGTLIPYTIVGRELGMSPMPAVYFLMLALTIIAYMLLVTLLKKKFVKRYGELL